MTNLSFSAVNLTCTRGRQRLFQKLNFLLKPGESLYIKGANGSGKTSLLRLLAGLSEPQSGHIDWCAQNIRFVISSFRLNMLFLGHQNSLNLILNPLENMRVSWGVEQGIVLPEKQLKIAFEKLGLKLGLKLTDAPCYTLSAGQRRRVALTRLVLSQAKLWLLDEPFTALDDEGIYIVKNLMLGHLAQGGMIVYSSHIEQDLKSYVCQL